MVATEVHAFVHLGGIENFVWRSIEQSMSSSPGIRTILITDQRIANPPQGVEVVPLSRVVTPTELKNLREGLESVGLSTSWRKGYWLKVYLRFMALRNLCLQLDSSEITNIAHLESDVASYLTPELTRAILDRAKTDCLMPFIDAQTACPGVILAKTPDALANLCEFVIQDVLSQNGHSDMQALALAGDALLTGALPTHPESVEMQIELSLFGPSGELLPAASANALFDAAAVGQYLFGIDPRNSGGILIPGYRETRGGIDPGTWSDWRLGLCQDGIVRPTFLADASRYVLLNLHVHAKTVVPSPKYGDPTWEHCLAIANGDVGARPIYTSDSRVARFIYSQLRRLE